MIDPRLRSLQLVAWHGTVTAAAATLHYTPSAISAQLKSLADEVGVSLLVRKGRTVQLTSAGRLLLEQTEELAARWEQMHTELLRAGDRTPGSLRMCGFSTAAASLLPRAAGRVMTAHPGTQVRIIEADPETCFELLLADVADLAVVVTTASLPSLDDHRFEQRSLMNDPLDLLVPGRAPVRATRLGAAGRDRTRGLDHGSPRSAAPSAGPDLVPGGGLQPNRGARDRRMGSWRGAGARRARGVPGASAGAAARRLRHRPGAAAGRPEPRPSGAHRGTGRQQRGEAGVADP
jgi:DNA-binding transcriptional LysR family regulator